MQPSSFFLLYFTHPSPPLLVLFSPCVIHCHLFSLLDACDLLHCTRRPGPRSDYPFPFSSLAIRHQIGKQKTKTVVKLDFNTLPSSLQFFPTPLFPHTLPSHDQDTQNIVYLVIHLRGTDPFDGARLVCSSPFNLYLKKTLHSPLTVISSLWRPFVSTSTF